MSMPKCQFSFSGQETGPTMLQLTDNVSKAGWKPLANDQGANSGWFEDEWLPNLNSASAVAVIFSESYKQRFTGALQKEAKAILEKMQKEPSFPVYVVGEKNGPADLRGWLTDKKSSVNTKGWKEWVAANGVAAGVAALSVSSATKTYEDGGKYVGEMKDDKPHEQGTFTYASGNKYVGQYKDGVHHGEGTMTFANGTVQKGRWEHNTFKG